MNTHTNKILFLFVSIIFSVSTYAGIENNTNKLWKFTVFLDETPIGEHSFQLESRENIENVHIKANFDVSFLFIPVYSYTHENTETWKNNCLERLDSKTSDNGKNLKVNIQANGVSANINTHESKYNYEIQCLRSFAYWNPDLLHSSKLINAQNGEILDVKFTHISSEKHSIFEREYSSQRYQLTGENIHIDLWYTHDKQWLALESRIEDGSILRYQLTKDTLP